MRLRPIVSRRLFSGRGLPFVCVFANLEGYASFTAFLVVGSSGEQRVGKGIKGSFNGVLNNADYEANAHNLHGDVVADAEQGAAQRNKEQGTAGNTGSTTGTYRSQNAENASGNRLMAMPMVCAAAMAITVMVIAAPAMLMVAPSGMETE